MRGAYQIHESARAVEAAYEESQGEETPETRLLEDLHALEVERVIEALASYVAECRATDAAIAAELDRLRGRQVEVARREQWAIEQCRRALDAAGQRKIVVGTHVVALRRGRERVEVLPGWYAGNTPRECLREVPAVEAELLLDKAATRAWIEAHPGEQIHGVAIVRGPDTVDVR